MGETPFVLGAVFSLACGGFGAWYGLRMAARTAALHKVTNDNAESVRKSAQRRRRIILEEAARATLEQFEGDRRRLDEKVALTLAAHEDTEVDLNERQSELDLRQNTFVALEEEFETRRAGAQVSYTQVNEVRASAESLHKDF